ncbi:Fic family protein, partial [Pseudomonas aeruginosa]
FYEGMPEEFLQIKVNEEGETVRLVPGEFRDQGVKVGNHIPPAAENLRTYMGSSQKTENKAR